MSAQDPQQPERVERFKQEISDMGLRDPATRVDLAPHGYTFVDDAPLWGFLAAKGTVRVQMAIAFCAMLTLGLAFGGGR